MEGVAQEVEKANDARNSRVVSEAVRHFGGSSKRIAPKQPSVTPEGDIIRTSKELAEAWGVFCAGVNIACAEAELKRSEFETLGEQTYRELDVPSVDELEIWAALKSGKATGPGGVPVEAYRASKSAKWDLLAFVRQCRKEVHAPGKFALGTFVTVFQKSSLNDFGNYRLINLLNHSYKVLSSLLMLRLLSEITGYFLESQAGSRKGGSTRDDIYLLSKLPNFCLGAKKVPKLATEQRK